MRYFPCNSGGDGIFRGSSCRVSVLLSKNSPPPPQGFFLIGREHIRLAHLSSCSAIAAVAAKNTPLFFFCGKKIGGSLFRGTSEMWMKAEGPCQLLLPRSVATHSGSI